MGFPLRAVLATETRCPRRISGEELMLQTVKTEVFYPHPPQYVWQVLTDRKALAAWLMENDFEPRVGHKFRFQTHSLPGLEEIIDCEVLELNEPKRLAYTWQDSLMCQPSIVTWTLTPVEGGTRLQLEHRGLGQEVTETLPARSLPQPLRAYTWHDRLVYDPTSTTAKLEAIDPNILFQSKQDVGKYEALDRAMLNSIARDRWNYRLTQRMPEILLSLATNNK